MNIYQKLIEVRKEVPYLQKESKGYQFNYTGSSLVLGSLKTKMDELGLLLIPRVVSKEVSEHITKNDGKEYFTELCLEFTWVNAENPEEIIVCAWYGQGLDSGEKGVGKAMTYAEKYFMLKFFNIATDKDDPDSFQKKMDADAEQPSKKKPPASPPQAKPEGASLPSSGKAGTGHINDIQKAKIQELAKAVGKAGADITALCKTTYKKQFSQLTETEASVIIASLQIDFDHKTVELEPPSTPLPEPQKEDLFSGANMPEKTMKAIHARAAEIGMNHDDLRSYAQCQYPIKSLKDLNEEQGKALLADLRALPAMDQAEKAGGRS